MTHHQPIILNPDMDAAITAALAMHPDRPGVGRLCQELLSRVAHRPITARPAAQIFFPPREIPKPGDGKFAAARIRRRLERLEALLLKGPKA